MQEEAMGSRKQPESVGKIFAGTGIEMRQKPIVIAAIIAAGVVGYSLGRVPGPTVAVLVMAILTTGVLAGRQGLAATFYCILGAVLLALVEPRLLGMLGMERLSTSAWSTAEWWIGSLLLATTLLMSLHKQNAHPVTAPKIVPNRAVFRQRSTTAALLLNTVSRIPTFVRRFRPGVAASVQRMAESTESARVIGNAAQRPEITPADFVCRALPTPPEPVRRWPPGKMPRTQ